MALASSVSLIRTGGGTVAGRRAPTPPAASLAAGRRTVLRWIPKAAAISVAAVSSVPDRLAMARSRPTLSAASKKQIAAEPTKIPTCLPNRRITTREPIGIPSGGITGRPAPSLSTVSTTGTSYISSQFQSIINDHIHRNLTDQLLTDSRCLVTWRPEAQPAPGYPLSSVRGAAADLVGPVAGSGCPWSPLPQASDSEARPRGDVPCLKRGVQTSGFHADCPGGRLRLRLHAGHGRRR